MDRDPTVAEVRKMSPQTPAPDLHKLVLEMMPLYATAYADPPRAHICIGAQLTSAWAAAQRVLGFEK
ncbi:hypothetical protein P7K49_018348 [Saguinus oedipus]|uniref:Uncharacterized protein n=1 Tax=Saguinus oedipus TaxID=9490 RepID=A0ABQ9V550_SAGOE|nr:hypothetical protein P7K49_018348 [Saguinus oedipus]